MNDRIINKEKKNNNTKSICCNELDEVLVWTCALAECVDDTCIYHGQTLWDADWLIKLSITNLLSSSLLTLPPCCSCWNKQHIIVTLQLTSHTQVHFFPHIWAAAIFHLVCDDFVSSAGLWCKTGQQSSRKDSIVYSQNHRTAASKSRWQPSTKY